MSLRRNRMLALVVAVVMVIGLLPLSAMAAPETGSYGQIEKMEDGDQTAYYTIDAEGDLSGRSAENTVSTDGGRVSVTETISGTPTENEFKLKLTVTTQDAIKESVTTPDAAVVLVIDLSDSMSSCTQCNDLEGHGVHHVAPGTTVMVREGVNGLGCAATEADFQWMGMPYFDDTCQKCFRSKREHNTIRTAHQFESRIENAKTSAIDFLKSYAASANGARRMVSIVGFGSNSEIKLNWVDAAAYNWSGSNDLTQLINGLTLDGQTNTNDGLADAKALIGRVPKGNDGEAIQNTSVILLSDGAPTGYYGNINYDLVSAALIQKYNGSAEYLNPLSRAMEIQASGTKVYSICYGAGSDVYSQYDRYEWMQDLANAAYRAENASELQLSFDMILEQIKLLAQAWTVTVPFGKNMVFDPAKNQAALKGSSRTFDDATNTLSWNLRKDVPADFTNGATTYSVTFTLRLDTFADSFRENTWYPTNGLTTLSYLFEDEDGNLTDENGNRIYGDDGKLNPNSDGVTGMRTLNYRVPLVEGKLPLVDYEIRFFLYDREKGEYAQTSDTVKDAAPLWSTVRVGQAQKDQYLDRGYAFDHGKMEMVILPGENILELYYKPIPVKAVVNHYVVKTEIDIDGNTAVSDVPELIDSVSTDDGAYYAGDKFDAALKDAEVYTFAESVATESGEYKSDKYKNITLKDSNTVINLYYTQTVDDRRNAKVTVNHYTSITDWRLGEDGKYHTTTADTLEEAFDDGGKDKTSYTAALREYDGYEFDEERSDVRFITLDADNDAEINLYYHMTTNKPEDATLTVRHHYTTTTQLVNGTSDHTEVVTVDPVPVYVGETHTAAPVLDKDGHKDWNCTTDESGRTVTIRSNDNYIDVYYTREVDGREETQVSVKHVLQKWHWIVDEEGNGDCVEDGEPEVVSEQLKGTYYVGGSATAARLTDRPGYTWDENESLTLDQLSKNAKDNVIELHYDLFPADPEEADLTVVHRYETYTTFVNAEGKIETDVLSFTEESDGREEGTVGEWFTVAPRLNDKDDNGFELYSPELSPDQTSFKYTLTTSGEVQYITYRRYVNRLTDTDAYLNVIPVYVSYQQIIDTDGNDVIEESGREEGDVWSPADILYAGQSVSARPGDGQYARDGFTFSDTLTLEENHYENVLLGDAGSTTTIYLIYTGTPVDMRSAPVNVQLRHHYVFVHKSVVGGTYTETETVNKTEMDAAIPMYVGQIFATAGREVPKYGCSIADPRPEAVYPVPAEGLTITFEYTGEKDKTAPATLKILHRYSLLDHDGTELMAEREQELEVVPTGKLFVGQNYAVSPEYKGNIFTEDDIVSMMLNEGPMDGFDITLNKAENTVVINYVKKTDTRTPALVTVVHEYAVLDTFTNIETSEGSYTETFKLPTEGAYVGAEFRAALRLKNSEGENAPAYGFRGASSGDKTLELDGADRLTAVTVGEAQEGTAITIQYLREVSSEADNTPDTDPDPKPDPKPDPGPRPDPKPDPVGPTVPPTDTTTPEAPKDDVVIGDEDVPLGDLPVDENPPALPPELNDDFIIVDEQIPLGNLPQTGSKAHSQPLAFGFMGLSLTMTAAGFLVLSRKKENKD